MCSTVRGLPLVTDSFIEGDYYVCVIDSQKGESLRNSLLSMQLTNLPEVEVRKCICQVMIIVKQLHDRRVRLGMISLDTIITRQRRGGLEMNLSNFSNAVYYKR